MAGVSSVSGFLSISALRLAVGASGSTGISFSMILFSLTMVFSVMGAGLFTAASGCGAGLFGACCSGFTAVSAGSSLTSMPLAFCQYGYQWIKKLLALLISSGVMLRAESAFFNCVRSSSFKFSPLNSVHWAFLNK